MVWLYSERYRRAYGIRTRTGYTFECRKRLCLAQVKDEDVHELTRMKGCCGHARKIYRKATPEEIARWTGKPIPVPQ